METARLKKNIAELKKQYGGEDDIFNTIANWPYMGLTAAILSIVAVIVAVAVK